MQWAEIDGKTRLLVGGRLNRLTDPAGAVTELQWALGRRARVIVMRSGPVLTATGLTSPGDRRFDRFWALANKSRVVCAYHGADDAYKELISCWGESAETETFRDDTTA